jgi:hypothetical protein
MVKMSSIFLANYNFIIFLKALKKRQPVCGLPW